MTRIKKRRTGKKRTSDLKKASAGRRSTRPKAVNKAQEPGVAEATEKKIRSYTKSAKPAASTRKSTRTEKAAAPKKARVTGRVRPVKTTDKVKLKPRH